MDPRQLLVQALTNILLTLIGAASGMVRAFVLELQKQASDDPTIEETIDKIVEQVGAQHADLPWHQRLQIAEATAASYFIEKGKDVTRALLVTMLSAKVLEVRLPPDSARTIGSTP